MAATPLARRDGYSFARPEDASERMSAHFDAKRRRPQLQQVRSGSLSFPASRNLPGK